jgi:hypothetical protein
MADLPCIICNVCTKQNKKLANLPCIVCNMYHVANNVWKNYQKEAMKMSKSIVCQIQHIPIPIDSLKVP